MWSTTFNTGRWEKKWWLFRVQAKLGIHWRLRLESKDSSYAHLGILKTTINGAQWGLKVRTSVVTPVETHLLHTVTYVVDTSLHDLLLAQIRHVKTWVEVSSSSSKVIPNLCTSQFFEEKNYSHHWQPVNDINDTPPPPNDTLTITHLNILLRIIHWVILTKF